MLTRTWGKRNPPTLLVGMEASTIMFFATLFPAAKLWEQPRCPTIDEWIKKMWYLYTMEFFSTMKKNEILSFTSKWMQLENIIL
jgi:hypothetical protein